MFSIILKTDIPFYILKERVIPDCNCLFRSFSYFLYNTQGKPREVRLKIISNVIKNWLYSQPFIIGDESHGILINDQKIIDGVYGGGGR